MSSSEHRTERQKNTVVAVLVILKRGLRIDGPNKKQRKLQVQVEHFGKVEQ